MLVGLTETERLGPAGGGRHHPRFPLGRLYAPTLAGLLSLAIALDVFSRRVSAFVGKGWSMAGHLRTELVPDALDMAVQLATKADLATIRWAIGLLAVFVFAIGLRVFGLI